MTRREAQLTRQLEQTQVDLAAARTENALLRQKIELLVRRVFGASSERLDPAQLELLLQPPQPAVSAEPVGTANPERPRYPFAPGTGAASAGEPARRRRGD